MLLSARSTQKMLTLILALTIQSDLIASDSIPNDVPKEVINGVSGTLGALNSSANSSVNQNENPCPQDPTAPGCSNLIESFCADLYSQKNQGNLDLQLPDRTQQLRFGNTPNGVSYTFALYQKAKFDSREKLPQDLQKALNQTQYFAKMQEYLKRKSFEEMNINERKSFARLSEELRQLWNSAIDDVMWERMESKYPGYSKLTQFPPQLQLEHDKVQNDLYASIYGAIWNDHPLWKQIESDFKMVKSEYIQMLEESQSLTPDLKKDWIDRIQTTKLMAPGTDPGNIDHDCATTNRNAFNATSQGFITVCAGYLTSGNMISTLAHELSHSLGVSRSKILFERNSELGKRLYAAHQSVCKSQGTPQCPKDWSNLKNDFSRLLDGLKIPEMPNAQYLRCLQYHEISQQPSATVISNQAKVIVASEVGQLADMDLFLKFTEKELPLANGKMYPNPR